MRPHPSDAVRHQCIRCGTCCRASSPTLHPEDVVLIEKGVLPFRDLFTIRVGELVHDNVRGVLRPLSEEMIKIKEEKGGACRFFNASNNQCGVYDDRPIQCRKLKCWEPSDLERLHDSARLSRADVLKTRPSLAELVQNHEQRFSYAKLAEVVEEYRKSGRTSADRLIHLLRHEFAFRPFVVDRASIPRESLDFLFGRPFIQTIRMHGLAVEPGDDGVLILRPVNSPRSR
jgi:Fe-S-cluster containining protein